MPHYTQILARTDRPTQALSALKGLDVYVFPHSPAGTLICERTSETLDVRIIIQVARGIGAGFWCGLFEGGASRFTHNSLTGPRDFAEKSASPAEVEALCGYFGAEASSQSVYEALAGDPAMSAMDRHAALARSLGLPAWSPGIGYSRVVEGRVPPEAGEPKRPPRSLAELRPVGEAPADVAGTSDTLARFRHLCGESFSFLEKDFGFRKEPYRNPVDRFPQVIDNVMVIGPGYLRPGYKNAYMVSYRGRHLIVVIEGLSFGWRTRLCLIDRGGRHLDLTALVERRDPELLDLCRLAEGQREQIPIFAEAVRKCASDVLSGDLSAISLIAGLGPGFSFSAFSLVKAHLRGGKAR
ncbi:MAG: hypothetical protein DMF53_17805 [Acidobacteria bacterium]|nr:MAG: hypothetical protein DMF53_17805 [Acidobacteriota bacterium]